MPRLYLVRHGRATGGYGADLDPGLDDVGRAQAAAMADRIAPLGPLHLLMSPLQRARETAGALEARWGTMGIVDPSVGEIPAPVEDLEQRHAWLQQAMGSTYTDLGPRYRSWRTMVSAVLLHLHVDTVVVTHFVAINAVLGVATGDDRVMSTPIGNGSVTVLDHDHDSFEVVEIGSADATTVVQ
jgi:broad specificity phosphatase PhoE